MRGVAVVDDSTHYVPRSLADSEGIHQVSLYVGWKGDAERELDMDGFAASSGSACTSGSLEPSHVILALGYPRERALGSLRLSVGKGNTDSEIVLILDRLPGMVARLRAMTPISAA